MSDDTIAIPEFVVREVGTLRLQLLAAQEQLAAALERIRELETESE